MHFDDNVIDMFLNPGEYFVGDAFYRVRTLLGSCVSITLWHPGRRVGAMSHFLLAHRGLQRSTSKQLDGRYGEEAMELMLTELRTMGINPRECRAKIFGGGDMFPRHRGSQQSGGHVGRRNGEAARELAQAHGIPIISESLFGIGHRQIIFDIRNGDVWSRQIRPSLMHKRSKERKA